MSNRFDDATEELTPEPVEVYLSYEQCPIHNFYFINTPRDVGSDSPRLVKCPLRSCNQGK